MRNKADGKRWWVLWVHLRENFGAFELHSPWWVSGHGQGIDTICAAIIAPTKGGAKEIVFDSYDKTPNSIEFRFVDERPGDWCPWIIPEGTSRFQKADWMQWPEAL